MASSQRFWRVSHPYLHACVSEDEAAHRGENLELVPTQAMTHAHELHVAAGP